MKLKMHSDGGSLSNPGQAASAYLIYNAETGELLSSKGIAIGIASNNVAEYKGLIAGLTAIRDGIRSGEFAQVESIAVFADSELMVKQINGLYKVKHADMRDLYMEVKMLENEINLPITYTHVLRDKNADADALVKKALGR